MIKFATLVAAFVIQLTSSEHHPHVSATWMQSPHDCALALMHTLPSRKRQHKLLLAKMTKQNFH